MKNISILVKPSSSKCNMRCTYCFYEDVSLHRNIQDYGFMSEDTMKSLIDKAFEFVDEGYIHFAFQGGEPTLIGLPFYHAFVHYVNQHLTDKHHVTYSIQTNGTTINQDWVNFFKEHHFLVGVSIDGTKDQHDYYRPLASLKGTHDIIMKHVAYLKENGVETNILSVVNNRFIDHLEEIYAFYKENKMNYLQFIPELNPIGVNNSHLDHDHYETFLKHLFDRWYEDIMNQKLTSIRYFDNMLLIYLGYEPESCDLKGVCSIQNVVESDGGIYPCDFYVTDEYRLGSIKEQTFKEVHQSDKSKAFIDESLIRHDECYTCPWFKLCRTGCKRRRTLDHKDMYCDVYKSFFSYSDERFKKLARMIEQGYKI